MRKQSLKKLVGIFLVIFLIATMTFALVACEDDPVDKTPIDKTPITTPKYPFNDYFGGLWNGAKHIGMDEVGPTDDVKISLDLSLAIEKRTAIQVNESINLGINAMIVLDRFESVDGTLPGNGQGENTAFRVQFYNQELGKVDGNLLTAYYFLNDSSNAYIEIQGQKIVIPFDTRANVDDPTNFAEAVSKFLANPIFGENSLYSVISEILSNTGDSFSMNSLLQTVLNIANFDKEAIIDLIKNNPAISDILGTLKLTVDDLFDENGNIAVMNIVGKISGMVSNFIDSELTTYPADVARKTYNADISKLMPMISLLFPDSLSDNVSEVLKTIFSDNTEANIKYETRDDKVEFLEIGLGFVGNTNPTTGEYLGVKIRINEVDFENVQPESGSLNAQNVLNFEKLQFSDKYSINSVSEIDLTGLVLNIADKQLSIDEKFTIKTNLQIDLKNKGISNNTKANVVVSYGDIDMLKISYFTAPKAVVGNEAGVLNVEFANVVAGDINLTNIVRSFLAEICVGIVSETNLSQLKMTLIAFYGEASEVYKEGYETATFREGQSDSKTFYYPTTIQPLKGVSITGIDLVAIFQDLIVSLEGSASAATTDATTASASYVGALYEIKKFGRTFFVPINESLTTPGFNFSGFITVLRELIIPSSPGSVEISSKNTNILNIAKDVLGVKKITLYEKIGGKYIISKEKINSEKINQADQIAAIISVSQEQLLEALRIGLVSKRIIVNVSYDVVNKGMFTLDELVRVYNFYMGRISYENYEEFANENDVVPIAEVEFNEVSGQFETYLSDLFKGSVFLKDTAYATIDNIIKNAQVTLNASMIDGLSASVAIKIGDWEAKIGTKITVSSDSPVAVTKTPAGMPLDVSAYDETEKWLVLIS